MTAADGTRVQSSRVLPDPVIDEFWPVYLAAFAPFATRAAARHVLEREEFVEEMRDERILKLLAREEDGRPAGLTTLATDLHAVPWISPEFYTSRYPEHAARGTIYYVGFTLVHPEHRRARVFTAMLDALVERFVADRAIAAYDISRYNDETMQFAERLFGHARLTADVDVVELDVQTFYAGTFHGPRAER